MRLRSVGVLVAAITTLLAGPASAVENSGSVSAAKNWDFVTRSGSRLEVGGTPFRFSGANIEWLGLIGYGPLNFEAGQNERFPSHYEIDDALATAKEMGATVVRAQTLGDTVGCPNCLEPTLGTFNPQAFQVMDYAIARAPAYGIRVIPEFQGDARAEHVGSSADIFSNWRGGASFWTDPTVIKDFESHIAHIVNHVNTYTGIPYKDDRTILGWMDCNACQLFAGASTDTWVTTIANFVKSLDPHHLFLSNATGSPDAQLLAVPTVDAYAAEVYPHWIPLASGNELTGHDPGSHQDAARAAAAGKAWMMSEFGWDHTNWTTASALQTFLGGIEQDPNISGDFYWALEGHANGYGWKPIPANDNCEVGALDISPPTQPPSPDGVGCQVGEDGNWWALYYTGIPTLSNTQSDMAQRAQMLRTHAYAMRGLAVPPHDVPPPPTVTSITSGRVYWQGSAGAPVYSIEHASAMTGPWAIVCDRCVSDLSNGWPETVYSGYYRVIPYNIDGAPGPASPPYRAD
ncbi:hypothetical protein [Streptomyces sp. 900105755]